MNSDERILQVLDNSACLSKGQLLGYLKNNLYPEELRAVELHLAGCPLCNDALEGLELQPDAEKLLASLVPPVLPAIAPKEKPKEKKEAAPVIVVERPAAAKVAEPLVAPKNNEAVLTPKPRGSWKRPLGIAAALIIGFSALWYFELRPKNTDMLADRSPTVNDTTVASATTTENRRIAAAPEAVKADESLLQAEAKRTKDSIAARRSEARKLAQRDSVKALAAPATMAARQMNAEQVAETTAKNEVDNAAEKDAVAAKVAKVKDEAPKKEELSDYENGLKLYKQNQYASALMYLKEAESDKANPKHWDAVFYSALCNKYLGKDRRARKQFERIVEAGGAYKKAAQKQLDEMKSRD